jgi:membrane protein
MGVSGARARAGAAARRGQEWVDGQDPASKRGTAIGAWQRYREIDGPLQSLLLTTYVFLAIVPALIVLEEYLDSSPRALADHLAHHFALSAATAGLLRSVLVDTRTHELGSALLAVAGALFFGLGFGRVLQLVHVRAWRLELPKKRSDQGRYALVLLGLCGLLLLLLVQAKELTGGPSWDNLAVAPGWVALLTVFFIWAPRLLTYGQLSWRDLLPSAVLTGAGLVAVMIVSSVGLEFWLNFYARDYGGFGVVMAIFFCIGLGSSLVVFAASLSPALARRRGLRRAADSVVER